MRRVMVVVECGKGATRKTYTLDNGTPDDCRDFLDLYFRVDRGVSFYTFTATGNPKRYQGETVWTELDRFAQEEEGVGVGG